LAEGDARLSRIHELWLVPLAFGAVFALGPSVTPYPTAAHIPISGYSQDSPAYVAIGARLAVTPRPTPTKTPTKTVSLPAPAVLGAATHYTPSPLEFGLAAGGGLGSLTTSALNAELADTKSLGMSWVRFDLDWSNVGAAGPGQYNWTDYDRVISAIHTHGLAALPILDFTPGWAQSSACAGSKICKPANASDYGQFAAAAAARYAPTGVTAWEIWNEPNNNNFFQPAASASDYTMLLKAASSAIRGIEPTATILTGGLAPEASASGNLSPPDFVRGMYASGARGYFTAVADHPYTWPYSPAYYLPDAAWDQMNQIHAIMSANGDGGKQIWITEFGAPTGGPGTIAASGMTTSEGGDDHVTEGLQAKMVTDGIAATRSYPWVGTFFWYSYQDAGTDSSTVENFFGLLRPDGSRKPAYEAMQQAISGN
jgi:hypothetical protein